MPRPIINAMILSIAIHVAIFVVADWLLRQWSEPSATDTVLIVGIQAPEVGSPAYEEVDDLSDPGSGSPNAVDERFVIEDAASPSMLADATPVAAEIGLGQPVEAVSELSQQAAIDDAWDKRVAMEIAAEEISSLTMVSVPEPVITTVPSVTRKPVVARAPVTSKQEKMLNRKFKQWAENLHRMPETSDGLTWRYRGQDYHAKFTDLPAEDDMGIQRAVVEISTEEDGQRLSTQVRMRRLTFSNYAQFVNRWDPYVQMHNDELDGRFHSNSEINLSYSRKVKPQFHGAVTTSARGINITDKRGHLRRDQIFLGGLQTGVRAIRLPKHFLPFPDEAEADEDQVHVFAEDARITFYADGSYGWQSVESESSTQARSISPRASYLIAAKKVKLHVSGTVNGKVLVYSPERIVIEGNLVYAQDPRQSANADDYLGLVSDKNVYIAPPDVTGPGDLLINAAIYAKRRFAVKQYRARNDALLYLYGSLTAGSLSATEPRYYTKIEFDRRLEELRPPGFPMTNRYEVESWDTTWQVE